ncbi:MAG: 50S ribosomal protein L17 [Parcubacteria group bacterium]
MQHGKGKKKFGRPTKQRVALMKSLVVALIEKEKITTTLAKAKGLRPIVEKMITKGKKATLAITRNLIAKLDKKSAAKIIKELSPRFMNRPGGYTRIRHLAPRLSDGAKMAIIEFLKD